MRKSRRTKIGFENIAILIKIKDDALNWLLNEEKNYFNY